MRDDAPEISDKKKHKIFKMNAMSKGIDVPMGSTQTVRQFKCPMFSFFFHAGNKTTAKNYMITNHTEV